MQVIAINQDPLGVAGDIIWKVGSHAQKNICSHALGKVAAPWQMLVGWTGWGVGSNVVCVGVYTSSGGGDGGGVTDEDRAHRAAAVAVAVPL